MTTAESPGPTVDDVLSSTPGDAFGLRASAGDHATILAGEIDAVPTADPDGAIAELRADAAEFIGPDTPLHVAVLDLDAAIWWASGPEDGGLVDKSERLRDRPPARPRLGEPPQDPPGCSISYRDDGRLGLTIPSPVFSGRRAKYYAPADHGTVVEFTSGSLVDPRTHLAPDESLPTDSLSDSRF